MIKINLMFMKIFPVQLKLYLYNLFDFAWIYPRNFQKTNYMQRFMMINDSVVKILSCKDFFNYFF